MRRALSARLKAETQPQHDETEHHPLNQILLGSEGPARAREAYFRLLGQHLHIQGAFEPLLREAAAAIDELRSLVRPHHYHLDKLRDDIVALAVTPNELRSLPATDRFVSFIEACASRNGCELLGVFYVFEGSTNGGTIIGKRLKELLDLPGDTGTRFVNPHGRDVRPRWTAWKAALDALDLDEPRCGAVIAAARETFGQLRAVLEDVHRAMSGCRSEIPEHAARL